MIDRVTSRPTHHRLAAWYVEHARDLPWRAPGTTPWGVLVSEVMCQQTPAARVAPQWVEWMERWPAPSDLAEVPDRRRAARLGPAGLSEAGAASAGGGARRRRALRRGGARRRGRAARTPGRRAVHSGRGCGAFGVGLRSLVLDTNVRRVLARLDGGVEFPLAHETAAERRRAWDFVPDDDADAALWSVSAMELGALVCTAKTPRCGVCPVADACAWWPPAPSWDGPERRVQAEGTDRQCRGRIMAALRGHGAVRLVDVSCPTPRSWRRARHRWWPTGSRSPSTTGSPSPNSCLPARSGGGPGQWTVRVQDVTGAEPSSSLAETSPAASATTSNRDTEPSGRGTSTVRDIPASKP